MQSFRRSGVGVSVTDLSRASMIMGVVFRTSNEKISGYHPPLPP